MTAEDHSTAGDQRSSADHEAAEGQRAADSAPAARDRSAAFLPSPGTELRRHAGTGRPILVAPGRRGRPLKTLEGRDGAGECPFCQGAELQTPPERAAHRPDGSAPDTPGWTVRAFANLYPAAPWHEVVAEGPDHLTQPGDLTPETWRHAVQLWRERVLWLESRDGVAHAFLFKNVGRQAGASIAHNHSQIIGLAELPPRLQSELEQERRHGSLVGRELDRARAEGRVLVETDHHVAFAPRHPRLPDELWLAPTDPATSWDTGDHQDDLAAILRATCHAYDQALNAAAFNCWLHRIPGDTSFHWHFEFQPRTGFLAGLELGADAYINALPAAESVARLRAGLARETNT